MSRKRDMVGNAYDAESSVLGAAFLRGSEVLDAVELRPEQFGDPRCRHVWAAMRALHERNAPIDPVTVLAELGEDKARAVGGISWLGDVSRNVPTADNVGHYAGIVADAALKREVAVRLDEVLTKAASDPELTGADALALAQQALGAVALPTRDTTLTMREAVHKHVRELQAAMDAKARGETVSLKLRTGISGLDAMLRGGLGLGVSTVLAGRPSMGKSALARSIADGVNALGEGVHVISAEDTCKAYVMRGLADHADVDLARLWDLGVGQLEWRAVLNAANHLYQRKGWLVDDARGLRIDDIRLRVRRHLRANRTKLVVIDYAQIIGAPGDKAYERIAAVSKGAADLARDEGVAVLLLSQLNRENEKREGNRPSLADLRGAGELEQDADVVLMVHRPEYYLRQQDVDDPKVKKQLELWAGLGQVICAKAKNGPTGQVALGWDAKSATYRDRGRKPQENAA